jgi:hypothetical protein
MGETPDIKKVGNSLDSDTRQKIGDIYNRNSQMFDGAAKLPAGDFALGASKPSTVLTGKGGRVADLKDSDPIISKVSPVTEFSLEKKPGILSAAAKTAVAKASAAGVQPGYDCEGTIKSWEITNPGYAATCKCSNGPDQPPVCGVSCPAGQVRNTAGKCVCADSNKELVNGNCVPICSGGQTRNSAGKCGCAVGQELVSGICAPVCSGGQTRNSAGKCECPAGTTLADGKCSSSDGGSGKTDLINRVIEMLKDLYHKIKGDTDKCGGNYYNPKTECCADGKTVGAICGTACYDSQKDECCENGKKQGNCKCYHLENRIKNVEKFLTGYNQGKTLKQIDSSATTVARTRCWLIFGPQTVFYPGFYTLDPEIQAGLRTHENIHVQQCKDFGWEGFGELAKEKEYVLEIPAYQAEQTFLNGKFMEACNFK